MIYKALDVREVIEISSGSVSNHSYGGSNSMSINSTRKIVVIAEDEEYKERKRFHFYEGYKEMFLGEMRYYGYAGDFDLLIPGDKFEVKETSTWPAVRIAEDDE
jgi:hypothetical protein